MILKNFIVFEGIDGTGTTSQLQLLKERFAKKGKKKATFFTQEPTNGVIGKIIRKILSGEICVHPETMARLFSADRGEHLYGKEGISEALTAGKVVFSDRYLFSSLAYQGLTAGERLAQKMNEDFPLPEYLFFFDLSTEIAMERVTRRNQAREIYEKEDFQNKVRQRYHTVIQEIQEKESNMKTINIDASLSVAEIHENIWRIVENLPIKE